MLKCDMTPLQNNQEKILNFSRGFQLSQCLFTATQLGIFDFLKNGVRSCDELARETQTDSAALYRLLRVLESMEIVIETAPQQFEVTDLAICLQSDSEESLKDFVLLRAEQDYLCWSQLPYTIKTGKSAFEKTFGTNRYCYNQQTPERSGLFDQTMSMLARKQKLSILSSYDFSEFDMFVDVGGGQGSLVISILKQYPNIKAVLFDQAETIERAHKLLEKEQLTSRCEIKAGSFFETLPQGKGLYILKHVLHNWDDQQAIKILQNCRQAMEIGKKLLIIEGLISKKTALRSALLDLMMLVSFASGKLRTESEFQKLLNTSGFALKRIIPTSSDIHIIEACAI